MFAHPGHSLASPSIRAFAATVSLIALATACGARVEPLTVESADIAFVGVNLLPMDEERVLEDRTVLIEGERIVLIGAADAVQVPEGTVEIDGSGKFLIPGLGEMHAHVPSQGGHEWMERVLFLYLANGITTLRGMLGQPAHLQLRDDVAAGRVLGPRIFTSGPSLNGSSIPDPDSARRAVRHQKEAGYDFLKIHPRLTLESYDAIVETANEVGIKWAGHVPASVGLQHSLDAGQASIDHLDQYAEAILREGTEPDGSLFFGINLVDRMDEEKIDDVVAATVESGVWNVPTQSLIENVVLPEEPEETAKRPEMRYWPQEGAGSVAQWIRFKRDLMENEEYDAEFAVRFVEIRRRMIKALADAGAGILLGSDAPQVFQVPGFSIHQELRIAVGAGLTPFQALEAGTVNVARYFDALDEFGTIEQGKIADLVLLDGNPLENIENAARQAGVMARGRWVPESEIRERLEAIAAEYASGEPYRPE